MKKIISVLLILIMCFSLGSCKNDKQKSETKKEFTYWCSFPSAAEGHIDSLNDMTMYKEMEKRTGVHINFKHPPKGKDNEQFNLLMAEGIENLPDMIEFSWAGYPGGAEKAIEDGVIIDLTSLIDKYAPNLKKILSENPHYAKPITTDSGKIYGFPFLNEGKYRTFGGLLVRKDWLDDLGLGIPETVDEWENALRAFKNQKGASSPLTYTSEQIANSNYYGFCGAFGVHSKDYIDNGVYKYPPLESGYKDYLMLMNKWYEEGLLDMEFDTNSSGVVDSKMMNGLSGVTYGYIGSTMGKYINDMKNKDSKYSIVAAPFPVLNKGDIARFAECQPESFSSVVAITANCKDPVGAVKWLDYLYSEEGNILKNFGIEGLTYEVKNGKYEYTDLILNNPEGLSISEAMAMHFRANAPSPGFNQNDDYLNQYYQSYEQKNALELWSQYTSEASKTVVPPLMYTKEESEEIYKINSELLAYVQSMMIKFIKGEESFDNYDLFVENVKSLGAERYVELNQKAYDRYQNRG